VIKYEINTSECYCNQVSVACEIGCHM
jgi:hypothetical protein